MAEILARLSNDWPPFVTQLQVQATSPPEQLAACTYLPHWPQPLCSKGNCRCGKVAGSTAEKSAAEGVDSLAQLCHHPHARSGLQDNLQSPAKRGFLCRLVPIYSEPTFIICSWRSVLILRWSQVLILLWSLKGWVVSQISLPGDWLQENCWYCTAAWNN